MRLPSRFLLLATTVSLVTTAAAGQVPSRIELVGDGASFAAAPGLTASATGLLGGARSYEAAFDAAGVTFLAALGAGAPFDHDLRFEPLALERGGAVRTIAPIAPITSGTLGASGADGGTVVYDHGAGLISRYALTEAGLEQSFVLAAPFGGDGDLVVRGRLSGAVAAFAKRGADGTHRFASEHGGVTYGALTGVDAAGRAQAGEVRVAGDVIELRLPAAFVAGASYPLVLDPLIGPFFVLDPSTADDTQADAALDELTQRTLVVYKATFSAVSSGVRGVLLDPAGAVVSGTLVFGSNGTVERPRVATVNQAGRFLVVWAEESLSFSKVFAQAVTPSTGALSSTLVVDVDFAGQNHHADVGAEMLASGFSQAMVVWNAIGNGIEGARLSLSTSGAPTLLGKLTIAQNESLLDTNVRPAISRGPGYAGVYAVAYLRSGPVVTNANPWVALVSRDGVVLQKQQVFETSGYEWEVDVDGGGVANGSWVVAASTALASDYELSATPVSWTGTAIAVQPRVVVSSAMRGKENFSVSQRPGKAILAWQERGVLADAIYVKGVDPASCMTCEDPLVVSALTGGGDAYPTVSLAASSGGVYYNTSGLVLWNRPITTLFTTHNDILVQPIGVLGTTWSGTHLGGGCGLGGFLDIGQAGPPSVGNGYFVPGITGADPLASVALLNIGTPQAPLVCGSCAWTPYLLTVTVPVTGGSASTVVPIPCNPGLAGAQVVLQYTVISPTSTPCSLFPGFALSNAEKVTIGL